MMHGGYDVNGDGHDERVHYKDLDCIHKTKFVSFSQLNQFLWICGPELIVYSNIFAHYTHPIVFWWLLAHHYRYLSG